MKRLFAAFCAFVMVLSLVNPAAFAAEATVAATNGAETFSSLQAAVDGYTGGVIVLNEDAQNLVVTKDVYVDLNGHDIAGVTVEAGTLYCMDSETDDYTVKDGVYGKLTGISGNIDNVVAVPEEADCAEHGYLKVTEDDGISFHCVNLKMSAMSLRASEVGVYYKSYFAGDELVAANVEYFGVALSVIAEPTAENLDVYCGYSMFRNFRAGKDSNNKATTGTLLRDIMKLANTDKINGRNANMPVYGRAYIKTADGYMFGADVNRSLKEQVEAIDTKWEEVKDTQKAPIAEMFKAFETVMGAWEIPEIKEGPSEKFAQKSGATTYLPGKTVRLGDLFVLTAKEENLSLESLEVTVSAATENDKVSAVFTPAEAWQDATLTFATDATGTAKIVITDNVYCVETVIYLEQQPVEKFTANQIGDKLLGDTIALSDLFAAIDGADIKVEQLVVTVNGETIATGAACVQATYTFTAAGVYTFAITDNDYCIATVATVQANEPDPVEKFTANQIGDKLLGDTIALSDLFAAIDGADIKVEQLVVTVNGETIATGAACVQATYTFAAAGEYTFAITDNDYCIATVVTVSVNEPDPVVKFTANQIGDKLLGDTIALSDLFAAIDGADIKVDQLVVTVNGETVATGAAAVQATYTFAEAGAYTFVITDNDYCIATSVTVNVNEPDPIVKFTAKQPGELIMGDSIALGDLFAVIDGADVKADKIVITLNGQTVATGAAWAEASYTFAAAGEYTFTITDNDYCIATNVTVTVEEPAPVDLFIKKFDKDFLYRVGNQNDVAVGNLFGVNDADVAVGGVAVSVTNVKGSASGAYTANATWTNGMINFDGTGIVKVTISAEGANAVELLLEVVDAKNLTAAEGTTSGGKFVLVKNINTSTYVNYWNCEVYGNGFTYSLNGAPTAYNSKQGHGILIAKNAVFDNLIIVGDVYDSYGAYSSQDYYNTAIDAVEGTNIIRNCYIANCAAPVKSRGGNVTIVDTTLYGGTVANLIISGGEVTLENVTTANFADGRKLVGMGIVIHSDATESAKLILNGKLTQYNFISEADAPSDSNAKMLYNAMFGADCAQYHFGTSPNRSVNTGIISMTSIFDRNDITDNANTGYVQTPVKLSNMNGYVYTQPNTQGSVNNNYDYAADPHVAKTYGAVAPDYSFDYTTKNYQPKQDGINDYCYEENGVVYISMDDGDTFSWDTSILTATKVGNTLNYAVSMNGTDYTGKSIAFNAAGEYQVKYTYTDAYNFKLVNGEIVEYSKSYEKIVRISVAVVKATTKHAEFTFGSGNTASKVVTIGNDTYVMPNVSGTSSTIGSTTVNGQTIYYPIVEIVMSDNKTSHTSAWYAYFPVFKNAVTITDYKDKGLGEAETFGASTQSMPAGLAVVGDPASLFKYQSSSSAGKTPVVKNSILVYSSPSISAKRGEYNTVIQYSYQDNAGTKYYYYVGYHAPAQSYSSICVTSDTLVTMADGTQKEIQYVTYEDQILVWNFYTGKYDVAPVSLLVNHGDNVYEVVELTFSDGTILNAVGCHGAFNKTLNEFVDISAESAESYIGDTFLKQSGAGFAEVQLVSYAVRTEYNGSYTILSAGHYNAILNGVLTISPSMLAENLYEHFAVGEGMRYDAEQMQADIEKYGVYTYADFAEYVTYEQFEAWGLATMKIIVGKGYTTYENIVELLQTIAVPNA